ncbi:hypothetical protein LTR51_006768 [Lithohypha guttulata]|nr:hypothetical protein LTR51_006768 [Lithohypha guttulata]
MAGAEVSSVIKDILGAFKNGLALVRTSGRKHRRRHTEPVIRHEEKHLHSSLSTRPQEIKQAYDRSVARHGRQFEVGDATSQSNLAQILLVLNTGLIKLLNCALSNDHKIPTQTRSNLYHLSETTAMDTLNALSELNIRLISSGNNLLLPALKEKRRIDGKQQAQPRADSCSQPITKPPVRPNLKNGGWVRSKSSPSIVSVVPSTVPRKTEQKRASAPRMDRDPIMKATTAPTRKTLSDSGSPPPRYAQLATSARPVPKPKPQHLQAKANSDKHERPVEERFKSGELIRYPSMYIVPSDFFNVFPQSLLPHYEAQHEEGDQILPIRPPKVPLHSRPRQQQCGMQEEGGVDKRESRLRPTSMMTFMTASTKIGEIPEHKLPDRHLTEAQRAELPMPYVVPDMLEPPRKRGGRGFKFWKKERYPIGAVAA